jgi:lipoprotein-anchoring transpeptidase ErfK/SrfK
MTSSKLISSRSVRLLTALLMLLAAGLPAAAARAARAASPPRQAQSAPQPSTATPMAPAAPSTPVPAPPAGSGAAPGAGAPAAAGAPGAPAPGAPALPAASPQEPADVQILLDRVSFSPGEVDGKPGENTRKSLAAFQEAHDLPVTGTIDALTWQNLLAASGGQPWALYTITDQDAAGPFYEIPADTMEQAKLPAMGYSSLSEMLGERFHCAPKLLQERNPDAHFAAGATLVVPRVRQVPAGPVRAANGKVRIVVSKANLTLTVDNGDDLLFFAPVSAGSEHDPLPLGTWQVRAVDRNPVFHYDPALFWNANPKNSKVALAAGPNNPVGPVWIDLSKEHYGIHGTPEPAKIGTTFSHGCVRLTNWDALTVAGLVMPGTQVVFEP